MGRFVIAMLFAGLAAGLVIGLTRDSQAPVVPKIEAAITRDALRRYGPPIVRTVCVPFQRDPRHLSCTAVQYESKLSYSGQVYVVELLADGHFRFRPYRIPLWLGI